MACINDNVKIVEGQGKDIERLTNLLDLTGYKLLELKAWMHQESISSKDCFDVSSFMPLIVRFQNEIGTVDSINCCLTVLENQSKSFITKKQKYHYYLEELKNAPGCGSSNSILSGLSETTEFMNSWVQGPANENPGGDSVAGIYGSIDSASHNSNVLNCSKGSANVTQRQLMHTANQHRREDEDNKLAIVTEDISSCIDLLFKSNKSSSKTKMMYGEAEIGVAVKAPSLADESKKSGESWFDCRERFTAKLIQERLQSHCKARMTDSSFNLCALSKDYFETRPTSSKYTKRVRFNISPGTRPLSRHMKEAEYSYDTTDDEIEFEDALFPLVDERKQKSDRRRC